jgi:hypothetical protein
MILVELALPDFDHSPTLAFQRSRNRFVTRPISVQLWLPKILPRFRKPCPLAVRIGMLVPEAAMDEYRQAFTTEDDVRFAGKFLRVKAEA